MALKLIVDSLEGMEDSQKALYVEKDGKFHLDVEGVEDSSGLKNALQKERERARDFEKKLAALKDVDPEEYTKLKKAHEEQAARDAEAKGQWETLKKQLLDKQAKELTAKDDEITAMRKSLENHLVDAAATAAIAEAKGSTLLLLPHVKSATRVVNENGVYSVQVVDANGNQRIADSKGTPMTIADLVGEMRKSDVFGRAFEASGATGSGATRSSGAPSAPGTVSRGDNKAFSDNIEAIASGKVRVVG